MHCCATDLRSIENDTEEAKAECPGDEMLKLLAIEEKP
jgi:hypothetical protein